MEKININDVMVTGRHYFKMHNGDFLPFDINGVEGDSFFGMGGKKYKMTLQRRVHFIDLEDKRQYIDGLLNLLNTLALGSKGEGSVIPAENSYVLILEVHDMQLSFVIWYNVELGNPHIKHINEYYNKR